MSYYYILTVCVLLYYQITYYYFEKLTGRYRRTLLNSRMKKHSFLPVLLNIRLSLNNLVTELW
jgi:hypothetical protein